MSQDTGWWVLFLAGIALLLVSGAWRSVLRWLIGPPAIRLDELGIVLPAGEEVILDLNPMRKIPGADVSIQLKAAETSVIYNMTTNGHSRSETVDVFVPGRRGVIFTLRRGKVTVLQRIGGTLIHNPELSEVEQDAVDALLERICLSLRAKGVL